MRIIGGKHRGTKLYTLEGLNTRPTLDRVKEALFNILQFELPQSTVLDLFAGSGALGLEAISRGAQRVILCDKSPEAIHIIEKNVDKLKANQPIQIIHNDYLLALELLKKQKEKVDIIFLDPPYQSDFVEKAIQKIVQFQLLNENGIILIETDRTEEIIPKIDQFKAFELYDQRKYGRAGLLFLKNEKEKQKT